MPSTVSCAVRAAQPEPSPPERRPASRPSRPASARAVPGRPSRHPSSSLRYPCIQVVAARAAAVARAGTRGSCRPSPVLGRLCLSRSLGAKDQCVRQKKFAASRRELGAFSAFQRKNAKKWEVNSEHGGIHSQFEVVNSQPGGKVDTFEKVVCTERSQAGGYSCATPTERCTQEGLFPSRKRSCGTRICAPIVVDDTKPASCALNWQTSFDCDCAC